MLVTFLDNGLHDARYVLSKMLRHKRRSMLGFHISTGRQAFKQTAINSRSRGDHTEAVLYLKQPRRDLHLAGDQAGGRARPPAEGGVGGGEYIILNFFKQEFVN